MDCRKTKQQAHLKKVSVANTVVTGDGKLGDVEAGIGLLPVSGLYLAFRSRLCSPSLFTLHLHDRAY